MKRFLKSRLNIISDGGGDTGGTTGRGGGDTSGITGRAARKCSVCRQIGHTKKNCTRLQPY